jgi:hypothetical protein
LDFSSQSLSAISKWIKVRQRFLFVTTASALCVFLFLLFTLLPVFIPSYRSKGQLWNGYYTVLVRRGEAYDSFLARGGWRRILRDPEADERIVSESTQTVSFSSFDGIDRLRIDHLRERFDPQDPRLDPYMKNLIHFFGDGGDWMRFFVPSRIPVFRFFLRLLTAFPGYGRNWRLIDFNIYGRLLSLILSAVFLLLLSYTRKRFRYRWILLLGYVPWFFALVSGDFYDLLSYYLLFSGWYLVLEESLDILREYVFFDWLNPDRVHLRHRYIYLVGILLLTTVVRMLSGQPGTEFLRSVSPLVATFMLAGAFVLNIQYHLHTHDHMVFSPVQILRRQNSSIRDGCVIALSVLILGTPILLLIGGPSSKIRVPVPKSKVGLDSFSWSALEVLWQSEDEKRNPEEKRLPDIAQYVVHTAYQEGLPYGEEYSFPTKDQSLTVSHFEEDRQNHRITKTSQVVTTYDDAWLEEVLSFPVLGSVERMFLDQGAPARIVLQTAGSVLPGFSLWKCSILLLFTVFVLFSFDFMWRPVLIYSSKNQVKIINRKAA